MQIACTKKLLDEMGIKPAPSQDAVPLYIWRANMIKINRRKTVVLMCDQNRYVVVLYALKGKDFTKLNELILAAIRHTLLKQQINPEIVDQYISSAGPVSFVRNTGKSETAHLNHACRAAEFAARHIEDVAAYDDMLGVHASNYPVGISTDEFSHPDDQMAEDLKLFRIEPIYRRTALELTVSLLLDRETCVRKLVVPANITFFQLHKILQVAFEWQDYHLFDFKVFSNDLQIYSRDLGWQNAAIITFVCTEEDREYDKKAQLMGRIQISEYMLEYRHFLYTYDFGDNWDHQIEVTGILENYAGECPVCTEGEGNAPPEDVGGSYGFENFLDILANPLHEEHDFHKEWGEAQRYKDFDIDAINRRLRSVLRW